MGIEIIKSKPIIKAASACVWQGDRLLLIQRGNDLGKGFWSLPGGRLEPDETLLACAYRELLEETGTTANLTHHVGNFPVDTAHAVYEIACFTGRFNGGELQAGSDAADAAWVALGDLTNYRLTPQILLAVAKAVKLVSL